MNSAQKQNVLITGGSSGIGQALAIRLGKTGYHVIITARRRERLDETVTQIITAGGEAIALVCDLTDPIQRADLIREVERQVGPVDVLVNNAGSGYYGHYDQMDWQDANQMLQLDVVALAHLSHDYFKMMKLRGSGHIINISSIVGDLPVQGTSIYSSSKAFVNAFTTALYREAGHTGVHVSLVKPGPVKTEFYDVARSTPGGAPIPGEAMGITVDQVAKRIEQLILHPRKLVVIPWYYFFFPAVNFLFSWGLDWIGSYVYHPAKE